MASSLARLAGTTVWDGTRDPDSYAGPGMVFVRWEGRRLYYATANPLDEGQRDDARFLGGSLEAVPVAATRTQIADAVSVTEQGRPDVREPLAAIPNERAFRERLSQDGAESPADRLAGLWLLNMVGAPGRRLTVRAFNAPSVQVGKPGAMRTLPAGGRELALQAIYRIAAMARAPVGPGVRSGRIRLVLGRADPSELRVDVATTREGESLTVQRIVPYAGFEGVAGSHIAELRNACSKADEQGREDLFRRIIDLAREPDTVLDRLWALEELGMLLGHRGRTVDARAAFEEGLVRIGEHGIRGRAEAAFRVGLAMSERSDPRLRAQLMRAANEALRAPGPSRFVFLSTQVDEAECWLVAEQHAEAIAAARSALNADLAMFGAGSSYATAALAIAAESHAHLGEHADVAAKVAKLETTWCPPDEWVGEYARGIVAALAQSHHAAIHHLRRALSLPHAQLVRVAAALASSLLAVGNTNEAIAVARGVEVTAVDFTQAREAATLERIRRMAPYR